MLRWKVVLAAMLALLAFAMPSWAHDDLASAPADSASVSADTLLNVTKTQRGTAKATQTKGGKTKEVEVPIFRSPRRLNEPARTITTEYDLGDTYPNNTSYEKIGSEISDFMQSSGTDAENMEIEIWSWADTVRFRGSSEKTSDVLNAALARDRGEDLRREIVSRDGIPLGNISVVSSTDGPARVAEIRLYPKQIKEYQYSWSPEQEIQAPEAQAPITILGMPFRMILGAQTRFGNLTLEDSAIMDIEGVGGLRLESDPWFIEARGVLGYHDEQARGFDFLFGRKLSKKRFGLALGGGTWKWGPFEERQRDGRSETIRHYYKAQSPSAYGLLEAQIALWQGFRATLGGAIGPWEAPEEAGGVAQYTPVTGWLGVSCVGFPF